jgi:MFS superfamily sulfate permease-like transporter
MLIHLWNGATLRSLFSPTLTLATSSDGVQVLRIRDAAVFTNWLKIRKRILSLSDNKQLIIDLSGARLVDHSVMKKLEEMQQDWRLTGHELVVEGLHQHRQLSAHPHAARVLRAAA